MSTILNEKRGYESALSACPAPAAAFAAAAAQVRPRVAVEAGTSLSLDAVMPFQGTGLPVFDRIVDVPTTLVQPHPGDTARRPPS